MSCSPIDYQYQIAKNIIQQHINQENFIYEIKNLKNNNLNITKEEVINQITKKVISEIRETLKKDEKVQEFIQKYDFNNIFNNSYNILVEDKVTAAFEALPENVKQDYKSKEPEIIPTFVFIVATMMFLVLALFSSIKDKIKSDDTVADKSLKK